MNIKNTEKKLAGLLAATVAALVLVAMPGHAAPFAHVDSKTFTASTSFTFAGSVTMDSHLLHVGDNSTSTNISWNIAALPAPFTIGDSYILLNSTVTAAGGGVQIYTDNVNGTPKYTGSVSTASAAGLVATAGQTTVPLAWAVQPVPTTLTPATPNNATGPTTDAAFVWRYMKDHSDQNVTNLNVTAWADGFFYVMVKQSQGIQANTSTFSGGTTQKGYIYTEADFSTATTPNSYGTSTITLESFTQ